MSDSRKNARRLSMLAVVIPASAVLIALVIIAIGAEWFAPYDPLKQSLREALQSPSAVHWLGTDNLGRDVLSRLIFGGRIALMASAEATIIAIVLGVPLGLFIGYRGGWWDWFVMRLVEAVVSIPGIMMAIVIIAILGTGLHRAMIALGIIYSTAFLRLARSVVLAEREEVYVKAARVVGAKPNRILLRHILPNIAPPLVIQTTLTVGAVLLAEAGLSFIGIGIQPPDASWGTMLNTAATYMSLKPFLAIPPGIAIVVTVLSVNLLGDVMRDSMGRGIVGGTSAVTKLANKITSDSIDRVEPLEEAASSATLKVKNLEVMVSSKSGDVIPVVTDLGFEIAKGETLGLVGESGCGKTITGLAILGLIGSGGGVTRGSIKLNGIELRNLSARQLQKVRGEEVSMVFQDPTTSLNPAYTVGEQIAEVLRVKRGMSSKAAWARAIELIARVGIPHAAERAKSYPHELSGGMAQRIAIARALSCNPTLLIADEPTTALDVTVQQGILDLFCDLQEEFGMAILFITHDLAVAADICDRICVMYAGEMVEMADVDSLFSNPRHPYTAGLLTAMPQSSNRNPPLPTIRGTVPTPQMWPAGCRFAERCEYMQSACRQPVPLQNGTRLVRCLRANELELGVKQ
ncbi:dipeptide/oligopeptide/nickel ABC transporter permease/ATP-binding protein [bacterium]|nr:dipeptide/oligopeptide/nickel ABC transporter permease/ATP-binding protein [bacterium]